MTQVYIVYKRVLPNQAPCPNFEEEILEDVTAAAPLELGAGQPAERFHASPAILTSQHPVAPDPDDACRHRLRLLDPRGAAKTRQGPRPRARRNHADPAVNNGLAVAAEAHRREILRRNGGGDA